MMRLTRRRGSTESSGDGTNAPSGSGSGSGAGLEAAAAVDNNNITAATANEPPAPNDTMNDEIPSSNDIDAPPSSKAAAAAEDTNTTSPSSSSSHSTTKTISKDTCTLHEHLHNELKQLITVKTAPTSTDDNDDATSNDDTTNATSTSAKQLYNILSTQTAAQLLQKGKHEDRRQAKVGVVTRLLDALREDQTNLGLLTLTPALEESKADAGGSKSSSGTINSNSDPVVSHSGRIHGCVGSHWELLPPLYGTTTTEWEEDDNDEDAVLVKDEEDNNTTSEPFNKMTNQQLLLPGGGIRLPGLDWNKTFRKGYSILVWVRPTLNSIETQHDHTSHHQYHSPRKQVLYRFATSTQDNVMNASGVCAILGQWKAVPLTSSSSSTSSPHTTSSEESKPQQQQEGEKKIMLTTTITAYTLPNIEPMSHLYPKPTIRVSTSSLQSGEADRKKLLKKERSKRGSKEGLRSSTTTKSPTIGFQTGSSGSSAHARNMEHFQKQQSQLQQQQQASSSRPSILKKEGSTRTLKVNTTSQVRKDIQTLPTSTQGNSHHGHGHQIRSTTSNHHHGAIGSGYVTANLTLPADEWSLIGIQHTHPYLRRPELIVSVNGEEMMKGELGYPVLDAVGDFGDGQNSVGSHGSSSGGGLGISKSGSTSPTLSSARGAGVWAGGANLAGDDAKTNQSIIDEQERQLLRRRGILAECTLLDGAFDNGVQMLDTSSGTFTTSNSMIRSCTASVHSVAVLAGPPVPNAVLAIVAERGPLGDSALSSGSGLSFVLGPVPTNPQNRDAIVALSAGHGYYGSAPDGGGGGGVGGGASGSRRGGQHYKGGIIGGGQVRLNTHEMTPPRSLGIPVSIGITPGVFPHDTNNNARGKSSSGDDDDDDTWIGRGEEHAAHVCLQGLLGRVAWTFHSGDTKTLGPIKDSSTSTEKQQQQSVSQRRRIVCSPSAAPSRIGGADSVPKVGIVRPTPPSPPLSTAGLEVTGNANYRHVTWNYIQRENERDTTTRKIVPLSTTASNGAKYSLEDNHPVSFPRAIQAANAMNIVLLPFRLALPRAGNEEVNDVQRTLHLESFAHLNDLLSNSAELAGRLICFVSECIRCGGSAMRDEALQNGTIHVLATLVRKVLIRGSRLGLISKDSPKQPASSPSPAVVGTSSRMLPSSENYDYDKDHDSACPPMIPPAIFNAMVELIDACCGPSFDELARVRDPTVLIINPCRGLLRVRRASDMALTALFGLAMDFDLLGNDPLAAAPILRAIASRYCQNGTASVSGDRGNIFYGEDYGSLLRKQINIQYFLDCLRIRFDHSVVSSPKGMMSPLSSTSDVNDVALVSVASSLSDMLYTMLLSTLTSAAGVNVTRGERDVGALVATLTECPLGSLCAHVVTTCIARLLVKCGVMSSLCLGVSSRRYQKRRSSIRRRDPGDIALESRLGRNMLLCHYHDIVAPLLLSRSTPRSSSQPNESEDDKNDGDKTLSQPIDFTNSTDAFKASYPLDWTHHWRLSLLTFAWLSSLAGMEESQSISNSTGHLLLLAGKAGSLDGAILGCKGDKKLAGDNMLAVLSHFLVLSSSREKDTSAAGKKAESISRRLSAFMPLVPGIALSLLSSSICRNDSDDEQSNTKIIISDETALAVDTLKQLLSMLSLAIQALYGSKKGGLLSSKSGSKGGAQLNKAKKIFVSGAKEYVPILLQVVSMLDEPIQLSRHLVGSKAQTNAKQKAEPDKKVKAEKQPSDKEQPPEQIPRNRTDSTDKDWVDVSNSPKLDTKAIGDIPSEEALAPLTAPFNDDVGKTSNDSAQLEQSVFDDLCSCQDMALYAVSRLVAQAMKYGGGEASTAVWRNIVASLSGDGLSPPVQKLEDKKSVVLLLVSPLKSVGTLSKSTLCHLAALVLSKFARHHDHRLDTYRSPWNLETCSAVARLMDLVEEKKLLSHPEKSNRRGSNANMDPSGPRKYGIDQVRLLKALLEVMASGRESGGWSQIESSKSQKEDSKAKPGEDSKKNDSTKNGALEKAQPHSNYDLYHQSSSKKSEGHSNSKLLLPILQSCLRIIIESVGIIRSEAVVITAAATGKTPSTAKLLELVSIELDQSLTAAIVGLAFPVSRDIFMNATASLSHSISHHQNVGDQRAVVFCSNLLLAIVKAMRVRYMGECARKEKATFDAYEEDVPTNNNDSGKSETQIEPPENNSKDRNEGHHSEVIEKLILGETIVPKNDADFVAFPGDANHNGDPANPIVSPMGWSHYKGLGAALNRCYHEAATAESPEEKARLVLSTLESYIGNWDKIQIQDAAEAELVDLFDESIHLGSASKALLDDFNVHGTTKGHDSTKKARPALGPSMSASDAMARFIEAQSMLRHQHKYLAFEYLLRRRFGRSAFVERLSWKTWMECIDAASCNGLWERAVNDGGRDFSSKIATLPLFPQFPRFIPSYLDHSPSSTDLDMKLISKSIKIVDITKKEITEEMLEQYDNLNESVVDDVLADVEDDVYNEEADLRFSNFSQTTTNSEQSLPTTAEESVGEKIAAAEGNAMSCSDDEIPEGEKHSVENEHPGESEEDNEEEAGEAAEEEADMDQLVIQQGSFHFAATSFSFPPDSSSLHSMGGGRRLGGGSMEEYYSSCLHVKPDCSLKCTIMLTESHLIIEYEDGEGAVEGEHESLKCNGDKSSDPDHDEAKHMKEALRPKATRWNISEASHIYLRRYRLRDSALELFFIPSAGATTGGSGFFAGSRSLFIDFGAGTWGNTRRDDAANAIMKRAPMQTVKQWPDKSGQFLHEELKKLMQAWTHGAISNFDYLLSLNILAGRSYNDICQYPVFPWVLSNYSSEEVPDLSDKSNFRDLSKPIGALNEERLAELLDRFNTFDDPTIPPFMYGSHYSTSAGVVIHFLLRLQPFASLHRQLQSGHFDVADRLFSSVERTWDMCTGRSAAEVKELTPEFYSNPAFLRNSNEFKLGTSQDGEVVGDVLLPPWAKGSPEKFVEVMRLALESDVCSDMLPDWIDLIFGRNQQGKSAIEAQNVFFYLTYYGSVDVASIDDEGLRQATELQIAHFGQCPMQLFYRRHANKQARDSRRRRQTLSDLYDMKAAPLSIQRLLDHSERSVVRRPLPFKDAPLSYWVHLGAPPPGPHAPLISIRLALADRCLAVDSKGIFHFFRWAWKPDFDDEKESESESDNSKEAEGEEEETSSEKEEKEKENIFRDKGCFVAQRELFSFRNIPRLPYFSGDGEDARQATIGISKTLFANRSLLLVISDGDGKGALAMQLVDPIKGEIKGEVIVPSIHADCITAIDMDPIGTASGQGGVGGELVIVGSADGSATLWRFISSHYWPLRPRLRVMGHSGAVVHGVAISGSLGVCASISSKLCCLFDVGNGSMIRNFTPPIEAGRKYMENDIKDEDAVVETTFADTPALCLSILGFAVVVCSTKLIQGVKVLKETLSLELFTVEGTHIGSRELEKHRGMPRKIFPTVDGRAVFVCAGGGLTVHLVSSIQPLATVDEWSLSEDHGNDVSAQQVMYDLDFGPTVARPVVAAAGCSAGTLRLHALRGISKWSHEHQRNSVSSAVGSVLALPAQTVKNALSGVSSFGSSFFGSAKEISKEAVSVVKEREGGFFFRKKK